MANHQFVLILDFGGQYNQLIARRVRECGVYCEVRPYNTPISEIRALEPIGIIFTGGPASVFAPNAPKCDFEVLNLGIPVLGICYGQQLLADMMGGSVASSQLREYGRTHITLDPSCMLFDGLPAQINCWMSHTNFVEKLPCGFINVAHTDTCESGAIVNCEKKFYGVQFHPEVLHTEHGTEIIKNYLFKVCGCVGDWSMSSYIEMQVEKIRSEVKSGRVLCALSGGVDSAVSAALVHRAIGDQLTCMFVDHGLMRKDEGDEVERVFRGQFNINLIRVNAQERFLNKLSGVTDPERKRKIIGEEFIRVFESESKKLGQFDYLVQGTIYPDIIESGLGDAALIKSHHNVGGLPKDVDFSLIEPLRFLFKDEVRALGTQLGLPDHMVWRQPFPGPGLGVRVIGAITKDKLDILRDADAIFREEVARAGLDRSINQYFAVLTDMRSVGVMGDERTYDYTIALRGVVTTDFMTADWAKIPYEVLETVSKRIVNEVGHVNRIVYDITSKPPATIEWE